ncbi:MAG: hypothetical protein IT200_14460 [Thermoleophilia bacterium]|nr:hypothetical protein [Thermoleophilia bacterium]
MPPARRGTLIAVAIAVAVAAVPQDPASAAVRLARARLTPRAGDAVTVTAKVTGNRAALPVPCRLRVTGRAGGTGAPRSARRLDPSGRVTWSWRIPARTAPGPRRVRVRCGGAGTASGTLVVGPAAFLPRVVSRELVQRPHTGVPGEHGYAYLLRVVNPRRDFDLVDVSIGVDLVGTSGNGVAARSLLIERLPAGGTLLAGEQVTVVGDEPPVTLRVRVGRADGRHPPSPAATVRAVRVVRSADAAELYVRGEIANPAFSVTRPGDLTIALRDAQGRLVDVGASLTSDPVVAGGALTFDEGFFGSGYALVDHAEATVDAGR